jgi:hypothetical protein
LIRDIAPLTTLKFALTSTNQSMELRLQPTSLIRAVALIARLGFLSSQGIKVVHLNNAAD